MERGVPHSLQRPALQPAARERHGPPGGPILGAAKLTGKSAGKTSFTLIEAVTGQEHATLRAAGADAGRFLLEPRTNYLVGRLQKDLLAGNSNVGVLGTAVNRASSGTAYTGGVDWSLFAHQNTYQASGQVAGSRTEDFGEEKQGYAAQMELGKRAGLVQGFLQYEALSPGFDINDLGFVSRVGRQSVVARKELARPRSYTFTPYTGLSFNPDFRRRSLRSNLVLRWEYLPGSTLFLVWSQSRQDRAANPELQPWHNLGRSFADEGSNLFLVKLSYWMNI